MNNEIGIDIVEFAQFKERLNEKFINRILSKREIERYDSITNKQRKLEYIAGRFAAKEAYTKVYKNFIKPVNFTDVEILVDEFGAPYIESKYMSEDIVKVSISHSKNYVIAICLK